MFKEEFPADEATQTMMKKLFRRSSITPPYEYGKIKANAMPIILDRMGQKFDTSELNEWISKLDPDNSGTLDYEAYTHICSRFLKDPAALVRGAQDEFAFKHLIGLPDFAVHDVVNGLV